MSDRDDLHDDEPSGRRSWRPRRKWPWIVLLSVLLGPALILALWSVIALSFTYSSGDRTGYIQKLSKKGWICKTWEGELAMVNVPGAMQERFEFTVRSDSVAAAINALQGRRVTIHYREHKGVPLSCFGETRHFVDGVQQVDEMGVPAVPGVPATAPPPAAAPGVPPGAPTPGAPR